MAPGVATGTVRVKFFANYAELMGREETSVELPLPATVADVVRRLRTAHDWARPLPQHPLAAVNLQHARLDAAVHTGDEVAFLPPLAGG